MTLFNLEHFGSGAGAGGQGPAGFDWNNPITQTSEEALQYPILSSGQGDPLGLGSIFTITGGTPATIGHQVAQLARRNPAQLTALGQLLAAGLGEKPKKTYTASGVQNMLLSSFKEAGQSNSASLSDWLVSKVGTQAPTVGATAPTGTHVIPAGKVQQTTYTGEDIQAAVEAATTATGSNLAQKLIGRNFTASELNDIASLMNAATAAKAGADVQTTLAQQQENVATSNAAYAPTQDTTAAGVANTTGNFAKDLLKAIGKPDTSENEAAINAWHQAEGGKASFNPLNTTQGAQGASNYNSVGVKNYTSYSQGVAATAQTLVNGHYGAILSALSAGNNAQAVAAAVGSSPWGTSGSLMSKILGGKGGPAPISAVGTGGSQGQTTDIYQTPTVSQIPNVPSAQDQATIFAETQLSPEYQKANLLRVFQQIESGLKSTPTPNVHVRGAPVSMKPVAG